MYYDNEYTEQDAQLDMDAREHAHEEYLGDAYAADYALTEAEDAISKRYLAIGGVFADDAGPIGSPESDLDQVRRWEPREYFDLAVELSTNQMISARFGRGARRVRKVA